MIGELDEPVGGVEFRGGVRVLAADGVCAAIQNCGFQAEGLTEAPFRHGHSHYEMTFHAGLRHEVVDELEEGVDETCPGGEGRLLAVDCGGI